MPLNSRIQKLFAQFWRSTSRLEFSLCQQQCECTERGIVFHQLNDSFTNCSISCNFSDFHCCTTIRITLCDDDGDGRRRRWYTRFRLLLSLLYISVLRVITETHTHTQRHTFSTNYILLSHLIDIVFIVFRDSCFHFILCQRLGTVGWVCWLCG